TLAGVVYLGMGAHSFDMIRLTTWAQQSLSADARFWILLALLAGFCVKIPLFPVHTWLPLAHTEAPTAGSVILAGVLLKLGTYGMLRIAVPLGLIDAKGVAFPAAIKFIAVLCIVGIIYGALAAWVQRDVKKLVAYSSVSHLGFCVLGLVALTSIGMQGSMLYMINHGISTGALFLAVGMFYERYHTRDIDQLSGLARVMPRLAFFFVLFAMSSIGLPGLNGFVSEFLSVLGAFTSSHLGIAYGAFAAIGVILGAVYMLHMLARIMFGPLKTPGSRDEHAAPMNDINAREVAVLVPLAICVVILGVLPTSVLRSVSGPLELIRTPMASAPSRVTQDVSVKSATIAQVIRQ
ncbi:MAG: complex I subunit 4 family protein, partial [Tepidisphaeraceae bacterium]